MAKLGIATGEMRGGTGEIALATVLVLVLGGCWPAAVGGGVTTVSDGAWSIDEVEGIVETQMANCDMDLAGS